MRKRVSFDSNRSIIPVEVVCENKGRVHTVQMALDTGASLVRIPRHIAEALKLDLRFSEKVETLNVKDKEESEMVEIPMIRIDNISSESVKTIIQDLPEESRVDGLLGLSFLRNFDVEICFSQGYVEFAS